MAISPGQFNHSFSSKSSVNSRMSRKFNLSFAGCGFLGLYHVGVAVCFKKYAPQLLINRISGASAGGIAACFLLCDLPISAITSDVLNLVCLARKRILGPFSPSFNIQDVLGEGLRKNLPEDAHLMVSGKLHISLTKLPGFKNVIVSKFYSKEDLVQLFKMANPDSKTALYDFRLAVIDGLIPTAEGPTPPKRVRIVPHVLLKLTKLDNRGRIQLEMHSVPHGEKIKRNLFSLQSVLRNQALLASSFVPFFSGARPAKFHGAYYMDGCFSNNLVTLDENTITVSPLCGETDICPRDPSSQLFHVNFANTSIEVSKQNIYRFASILYPPNPEVLTKLCMQGFNDALRFLETNNLIKCAQYIAVESTFLISAKYEDKEEEHDPECRDCLLKREEAQSATLPKDVKKVFQDATDATTKGLLNWIYNFRAMKILSVMMLPYTLPFEIAYSMFSKLLIMPNSFLTLCEFIMDQLEHILQIESEPTTDGVACTCTCQLTDAEYCGMGITKETLPDTSLHSKNYTAHTISAESECLEHDNIDGKNNRRLSVGLNHCEIVADDTFDNILKVTAHHESLITLYYMGDNDKIKVTEFFEVTESEAKNLMENSSLVGWLEHHEQHIQKDADNARLDISNHSEDGQVFSNPESDWTESSGDGNSADNTDYRPESDQRTKKMRKSSIIKH